MDFLTLWFIGFLVNFGIFFVWRDGWKIPGEPRFKFFVRALSVMLVLSWVGVGVVLGRIAKALLRKADESNSKLHTHKDLCTRDFLEKAHRLQKEILDTAHDGYKTAKGDEQMAYYRDEMLLAQGRIEILSILLDQSSPKFSPD